MEINDWAPIETAPKGPVLIETDDGDVFQAYSFGTNPEHIVYGYHNNRVYNAVRWTNLPEPQRS